MSHTPTPDLHAQIMNLPCKLPDQILTASEMILYRIGHRDARHAAVELVSQRMEAAAQEVPSGLQALLAEAREAIEPLTEAQIRLHRIKRDLADRIDAALSASPAAALEKPDSEVAAMPAYGEIPWDDLIEAITEATGSSRDFSDEFHIGHQMAGVNMNSLNRIVSYFVRRAASLVPAEHAKGVRVALTDERIDAIAARIGSRSLHATRLHELGGITRTIFDPPGLVEFARAIEREVLAAADGGEA
jgi:hypothetical protein